MKMSASSFCSFIQTETKIIMKMNSMAALSLVLGLILLSSFPSCYGDLQVGFYNEKCGNKDVEVIIRGVVNQRFNKDKTIVAALLRLQFHDCFVTGCDASLLLEGDFAEKTAVPNLSVRGYDIIDEAKAAVEAACAGIVSCADIISIATRDAVSFSGGFSYSVQTGRRDGLVSQASDVDLPRSSITVPDSIAHFGRKGISTSDMVLLLGAHTVGITHCSFINDRLYNFNNTAGKTDPSIDPQLAKELKLTCPQNSNTNNPVNLDQNRFSTNKVDNSYYRQLLMSHGILPIDQALAFDTSTSGTVSSLADGSLNFNAQFGAAMIKLGAVGVVTDVTQGQIRSNCRVVNSNTKPGSSSGSGSGSGSNTNSTSPMLPEKKFV